jgi:2-C-methyl-D-erythritol 2,4-cyclodiphosphate synthase
VIVAENPKLGGHKMAMRVAIAAAMGLEIGSVTVKAKTAERLGPIGASQAMQAMAVVLLAPK